MKKSVAMKSLMAMPIVASSLIIGISSFAEEVSPKARMPTLAQARANPRSTSNFGQGWDQAVKEAEQKFNCIIKPAYAFGVGGEWNVGQGKSYIFDSPGGHYLKFDENGRLVKAGNRGQFEEIQWVQKRAAEIAAEMRKKVTTKQGNDGKKQEGEVKNAF